MDRTAVHLGSTVVRAWLIFCQENVLLFLTRLDGFLPAGLGVHDQVGAVNEKIKQFLLMPGGLLLEALTFAGRKPELDQVQAFLVPLFTFRLVPFGAGQLRLVQGAFQKGRDAKGQDSK